MVDAATYLDSLLEDVEKDEWDQLHRANSDLVINEHNRTTLLEMQQVANSPANRDDLARTPVDIAAASELSNQLQTYLNTYMDDAPEGHKWIILASLYLAFVARRPLHALDRTQVVTAQVDGATMYYCPSKTPGDNFICDACVCQPIESRPTD